jgi:hypothetical protein
VTAGLLAAGCTGSGTPSAGPTGQSATPGGSPTSAAATPTTGPATPTGSGGQPSATVTPTPPPTVPPTTAAGGGPVTYRIGPADAGKTVTLKVGDRLQLGLRLSGNRLYGMWTLAAYPRSALRLELNRSALGQYQFVATARGGGTVRLVRSSCGSLTDRPCLDQPEPIDPTRTVAPPGGNAVFTVTVRVV